MAINSLDSSGPEKEAGNTPGTVWSMLANLRSSLSSLFGSPQPQKPDEVSDAEIRMLIENMLGGRISRKDTRHVDIDRILDALAEIKEERGGLAGLNIVDVIQSIIERTQPGHIAKQIRVDDVGGLIEQMEHMDADEAGEAVAHALPKTPAASRVVKTIRNKEEHIGRNDPCPCGSGKKYKNCCMRGKNG